MDLKLDLTTILDLHQKWLRNEADGERANLIGADLCGANLRSADLRRADLIGANLRGANLRSADLCGANLCSADLIGADLRRVDLRSADLCGANLRGANLRDCIWLELALAMATHLPVGPFHAWKKCRDGVLVKLLIPGNARRSHGSERKCRAEFVKVLQVIGAKVGVSPHDGTTEYRTGQMVYPDGWDEDRWNICGQGIHFFLTRAEAENY
jgi:hypothetical protein